MCSISSVASKQVHHNVSYYLGSRGITRLFHLVSGLLLRKTQQSSVLTCIQLLSVLRSLGCQHQHDRLHGLQMIVVLHCMQISTVTLHTSISYFMRFGVNRASG